MSGKYLRWLSRRRLWPTSNIQQHTILSVLDAFESFPDLEYYEKVEGLPTLKKNAKSILSKVAVDVANELKGLCLSCVKHVTSEEEDGNCHAELQCDRLAKTQQETG